MMRSSQQISRFQVLTIIVTTLFLLALLTAHAGSYGLDASCVLFFPVFLFALLDLARLLQGTVVPDRVFLPQTPVLSALSQRPPPAFD